jgi:DNA-binding PadR family transcriptional regulator
MTDLIILATLLPGPKHGYQLKHEAGIILGQGVLHNNLVYPLLRRFMNNKWVSRRTVPGERGQTRHRYAITARGRTELLARLSAFSEQDARSSDAFRLRVGLFQLLGPETRLCILDAREKFLTARLAKLAAVETNFPLDRYATEVMSQFRNETQSELDWIKRLRSLEKRR